jgi:energy-coupling factor transporter transmembrane protein EcfT
MYRERFFANSNNVVAGLYPITKLILFSIYMISILLLGSMNVTKFQLPIFLILASMIVPALFLLSKAIKKYITFLKVIMVVIVLLLFVELFFIKGSSPWVIWQWKFIKIHQYGLQQAIKFCFSIISIAGMFSWIFSTSSNRDLCIALQKAGLNYKAAYVFLSTFEMIGVLGNNLNVIMDSQRARGVETEGRLTIRMKAMMPSLIPLVISAFISAEERTLTLESKGFSYKGDKTNIIDVKPNGKEKAALSAAAVYGFVVLGGFVIWHL